MQLQRRATAEPKGTMDGTKDGTRAGNGIPVGLSLGSPCLCLGPGTPIPQVAAVGLPLITHSWEGGTWGTEWASKGKREVMVGSAKKELRAVGWWAGILSWSERGWSPEKSSTNMATQSRRAEEHAMVLLPKVLTSHRARRDLWGHHEERQVGISWEVGDCLDLGAGSPAKAQALFLSGPLNGA